MEPTYSIPSTPHKTPHKTPHRFNNSGYNNNSSNSNHLSLSTCKPTPEQNAFNLNMFSEKKKNSHQTPKCPSPPLKSTPASRLLNNNANVPLIHHISSLSMFSPPTSLSDFMGGNGNSSDFSSSFGSSSLNSNGGYKIPSGGSNSNSNSNNTTSLFDKNFEILNKLGSGSFSDVFKVKSKFDGNLYAIKQARHQFRGYQERDRAVREVKTAVSLPPHPNVLQYYSSWEQNNTLFIQTELCENASLQDFLDSLDSDQILSEELIWNFLYDICLGVQHIHSYNMLHLDIKPENLFISNRGNIKIGDFGMAVKLELNANNGGNSGCGSNNTSMDSENGNNLSLDEDDIFFDFLEGDSRYLAFEFLMDKKLISKQSDIFSIGVTFFEMVTGKDMPANGPLWELLRSDKAIDFLEPGKYSDSLYRVILEMMKSDIAERISLESILENSNIKMIQEKRLQQPYGDYSLNIISPYLQYLCEQRDQELQDIKEFKDLREFKEKFENSKSPIGIPTPHFMRKNYGGNTDDYDDDDDENTDYDDSGRDSPIHFNLSNNLNSSSGDGNVGGLSFSTIYDDTNDQQAVNSSSPSIPTLSFSRRLSSASNNNNNNSPVIKFNISELSNSIGSNNGGSSNGSNGGSGNNSLFYGVSNGSSNSLLSSGEFSNNSSGKKKLGKRGLINPLSDTGSKIKRSFDSLPQENDKTNMSSPRNLLSLFQETS